MNQRVKLHNKVYVESLKYRIVLKPPNTFRLKTVFKTVLKLSVKAYVIVINNFNNFGIFFDSNIPNSKSCLILY